VVIGGIAIIVICAISILSVLRLRAHEIAQAERNLKALDLLLCEETERAIQSADLILRSYQEKVAADGVKTVEDLIATQQKFDTYTLLRSRIAGVPQIAAVTVLGPNGAIIISSRSYPPFSFDLSARDYFQVPRSEKPDDLFFSEPVNNLADGRWTAYLARRITSPSGVFLGVVSAAIDLAYFEELYKALDVGQGGAVSLWRGNGVLMARYPPMAKGIGQRFSIRSFSGILRSDQPVTYDVSASIDGTSRIVATMAGKQFPIVINVTETFDQILQDWRPTAAIIALGGVFCVGAVLIVMWLLGRQFRAFEALSLAQAERGAAVAARDHAEDQLRQSQKLEAVGQLTGGVAHDFNNLLTAVLGNLELLQRHSRGQEPRIQRWVQNALDAAQRGAILTQRLLAFSRRQPLNPAPTDVARLLLSMSDLLERTLGENIKLETRLDNDLRQAEVDPNQLDNAILNIAINARDAMDGRGCLTIEARNVTIDPAASLAPMDLKPGDYVLIVLTDTGRGIPPDVLDHVFEPFFTTKPIGQGTGLGLSQVYGFIKQTGGHIGIESELGVGTRVAIYLPRARVQAVRSLFPDSADDIAAAVPEALRVLVVEDDEAVLAYSLESMRELGYETIAASDAAEALSILQADQRIDLLFTDVGLPGLNGHELATRAKALRPDLKVLFVSGYTHDIVMHEGRLEKGVQLLAKPFTHAQLRAKIDQVMMPDEVARAVG
jgi:signal transduction histidine kinase/CheY-like chemotaxis protein